MKTMKVFIFNEDSCYFGRVLDLYQEAPWSNSPELVWKIKESGDDWFWEDELRLSIDEGSIIELSEAEAIKFENLKVFL